MDEKTCRTCEHLGKWFLFPTGPLPYCTCPWSTVRETKLDATCECWEAREDG